MKFSRCAVVVNVLALNVLLAQSPVSVMQMRPKDNPNQGMGISPVNIWMGGQVGYNNDPSSDFGDHVGVTGRVTLNGWEIGDVKIPLLGNLSQLALPESSISKLNTILSSAEGMNIGFYPYCYLDNDNKAVGWFSLVDKANTLKDSSAKTLTFNQVRASLGIEYSFGAGKTSKNPPTLSAEPFRAWITSKEAFYKTPLSRMQWWGIEFTGILPIGGNVGIIGQWNVLEKASPYFLFGFVFGAMAG